MSVTKKNRHRTENCDKNSIRKRKTNKMWKQKRHFNFVLFSFFKFYLGSRNMFLANRKIIWMRSTSTQIKFWPINRSDLIPTLIRINWIIRIEREKSLISGSREVVTTTTKMAMTTTTTTATKRDPEMKNLVRKKFRKTYFSSKKSFVFINVEKFPASFLFPPSTFSASKRLDGVDIFFSKVMGH